MSSRRSSQSSPVRPGSSPVRPGSSPVRPGSSPVRPVARPSAAAFRRRRVAAGVLGVALVVLTAQGADAVAGGLGSGGSNVETLQYRVRSGDTMWSIARTIAPGDDPREVVDLLVQAHGSTVIRPGDVINWSGV